MDQQETLLARVVIHDAPMMTPAKRKALSDWLRKQADALELSGENYARVFTARYFTQLKRRKK